MESPKEQKQSTSLKDNSFTVSDIHEFILGRFGLKMNKEYSLKEMLDSVLQIPDTEVIKINDKYFNSDIYRGLRESDVINSKDSIKMIVNLFFSNEDKEDEQLIDNLNGLDIIEKITWTEFKGRMNDIDTRVIKRETPIVFIIHGKEQTPLMEILIPSLLTI